MIPKMTQRRYKFLDRIAELGGFCPQNSLRAEHESYEFVDLLIKADLLLVIHQEYDPKALSRKWVNLDLVADSIRSALLQGIYADRTRVAYWWALTAKALQEIERWVDNETQRTG